MVRQMPTSQKLLKCNNSHHVQNPLFEKSLFPYLSLQSNGIDSILHVFVFCLPPSGKQHDPGRVGEEKAVGIHNH